MIKQIKKLLARYPKLYRFFSRICAKERELRQGLGRLRKNGAYFARNYLIDDERKLIYVSNAKVASTSIKASMARLGKADNYRDVIEAVKKDDHYVRDIDIADYPGYFTFTFVRDPFKRLVSCYNNKYHTDKKLLGMAKHGLYSADLYFDHYLLGFLAKDRGFLSFAGRVCLIPDCLCDRHFANQDFVLTDKRGRRLAQFVAKMEDMPEAFEPIRLKYDLTPLDHYNKTDNNGWMDAYDLATAKKVAERYKRDIQAFGYEASRDQLIEYLTAKEQEA